MAFRFRRIVLMLLGISAAMPLGPIGEAAAIDRLPFEGGPVGDARPGYGAERPGYGAERQYYGAESGRIVTRRFFEADGGDRRGGRFHERGSFIDVDELLPLGRGGSLAFVAPFADVRSRAGVYPGFGGGSFVYFGGGADVEALAPPDARRSGGPRIIDVERERLDARPVGSGGVDVTYAGGAKIIRIASARPAGIQGRDRDPNGPQSRGTPLEPWSQGWERYCSRTHPGFDRSRGTYAADDGSTRFCTGE